MEASTSLQSLDLSLEPDLHPLYPTTAQLTSLLAADSELTSGQKGELGLHCLTRACVFGDITLLTFLLNDAQARTFVDIGTQDEDGVGFVSLTTLGFGAESDRDVEREECVRLLVSQGADVNAVDKSGWAPLHYAALLAPPTLVSYLSTHGASLFTETRHKLTALDIVTAHSTMPGREDVALLLEEAMRSEGWSGGKMEERRRHVERTAKMQGHQRSIRDNIARVLEIKPRWFGDDNVLSDSEDSEDEDIGDALFTPPLDFTTMLVFSPSSLPYIFQELIVNFPISLGNSEPANVLYLLARFACLTCDHTWLEDLIIGATDNIEEAIFNQADDIACLVFWLYNTTVWLHLMRCDQSISEACDMLGSFDIIEELINSVFVFIIRFAERKIDEQLDGTMLDYVSPSSDVDSVQFESEWSFLRSFGKKKQPSGVSSAASTLRNGVAQVPPDPAHSPSPPSMSSPRQRTFSSFGQVLSRKSAPATPLQAMFQDPPAPPGPSPSDVTDFLTALHTLLTLSGVNPALITQLWSQIMYWTACELFNRILTRKKYLCRSRAVQLEANLTQLKTWIKEMSLPRGVSSHFSPVLDLLSWLQCHSSVNDFSDLIVTIQSLKDLNPLQMRRAVKDYRYEVNEGRMTEECSQYLAQLQKDWERHRVKLGVEALRKEIDVRDRDYDQSESSSMNDGTASVDDSAPSISTVSSSQLSFAQRNIDLLFDGTQDLAVWEPAKPPQVLGELLDSRYMLPLVFPSDPRMLAAVPAKPHADEDHVDDGKTSSPERSRNWRLRSRRVREIGVETLRWVDGLRSAARWTRRPEPLEEDEDARVRNYSDGSSDGSVDLQAHEENEETATSHVTRFTRKPSTRGTLKGRASPAPGGASTPLDPDEW
ncbi:hypothetical protein OE88DRAFT_1619695 [Heliocybe sulcata]|uniref:Dilute domain-containing protein n=1 Tax=Heliocybe sulcata TaxID=5364 RepID=A0A5C3NJI2_9AGAM|nr:hypothetical protein OE88DRAFT_1619695 [Heliocybe sulcata]